MSTERPRDCRSKGSEARKKIFPSSEAFDYSVELKKKNIGLVLATRTGCQELVGYLVFQRLKSQAWLHKLATIEQERGKGIARCLIHSLCQQMKKGGCRTIVLWVDEARNPARALYASCGFQQTERLPDYYGPGRTASKWSWLSQNEDPEYFIVQAMAGLKYAEVAGWSSLAVATPLLFRHLHIPLPPLPQHVRCTVRLRDHAFKRDDEFQGSERDGCQ